ncbi:MAG: ABC-F family ATP-binding cassette domain-containing protein, partial [Alphaproteobacteria bacterium]|nr:ABC-F family ATP-binding cassette domain-containing protein [Alphaproteobacteria bacterium]
MAPLLILRDVHLAYGSTALLDGAEMSVESGERLCLVGRNGSGKSTLLKIAAGIVEPDLGERFVQPGATIRYLPQEPDFSGFETLGDFVRAGLTPGDDAQRAESLLRQAGLSGHERTGDVSGGEARRAALVRALAPASDILLLDEPTNHLDLPGIEWLENELAAMRSALVLISHDRRFLTRLTRTTLWLDRGRTLKLDHGFARFEAWRDATLEQEEIDRHKLDRRIVAEQDWLRHGVSGRRKRNQGRLAGLMALRRERSEQRRIAGDPKLEAAEAEGSGTLVAKAFRVSKSYGEKSVVKGFSFRLYRGNRVAVIGANGAGKTTLVDLLTGRLEPDAGSVRLGLKVLIARLDQDRSTLLPDATLAEVLTDGHGDTVVVDGKPRHVISYMKDFLFAAEQARQPVSVLSGGERARLLLAKALAAPSNLLVLDEPTNDLDLETLDLLEEMIADYDGTVLLVSHDRDFLDRTASSVLMAEGGGRFVEYAGGYSDMLAQRGEGIVAKAAAKAAPKAAAAPREKTGGRRMTFKDKHALSELPKTIARAESLIASLQKEL